MRNCESSKIQMKSSINGSISIKDDSAFVESPTPSDKSSQMIVSSESSAKALEPAAIESLDEESKAAKNDPIETVANDSVLPNHEPVLYSPHAQSPTFMEESTSDPIDNHEIKVSSGKAKAVENVSHDKSKVYRFSN